MLEEVHKSKYSIHHESKKTYRDLKQFYWWPGMKLVVAKFMYECLTCTQVKFEHQAPYGHT